MKTTGTPYMQIKLVANKGTYLVDFNKQLLEKTHPLPTSIGTVVTTTTS